MPKIEYVYCDANVFLAYFNAEAERVTLLEQMFDEIQRDNLRKIMTSVISITEVSHIAEEKRKGKLDHTLYHNLENFWGDTSLIEFIDFNEIMARQARELIRHAIVSSYGLRTNDAIHLTSASYVKVGLFLTYDKKLMKFSTITNYTIREPYVNQPRLFPNDSEN